MRSVMQDFRYGLRGLRQQPGFAALAIVALALGIGATTTIFSVIENVLLDPFPYADANRIVSIVIHDQESPRPGGRSWFEVPEFLDYQDQNHVFEEEVIGGGNQTFSIPAVQARSDSTAHTLRRICFVFWAFRR